MFFFFGADAAYAGLPRSIVLLGVALLAAPGLGVLLSAGLPVRPLRLRPVHTAGIGQTAAPGPERTPGFAARQNPAAPQVAAAAEVAGSGGLRPWMRLSECECIARDGYNLLMVTKTLAVAAVTHRFDRITNHETQSRITNKSAGMATREKFARHRRTKGHNQRRARRLESPSPLLAAHACFFHGQPSIMLAFIFCMSAKTDNDLDNHSGHRLDRQKISWLRAPRHSSATRSTAIARGAFHGITCCLAPRSQTRCASRRDRIREQRDRTPRRHARRLPRPRSSRSSSRAFMA